MIDISKDMTDDFYQSKDIRKGKVLMFKLEDTETHLKIVRLNRRKKICLVEEVTLLTEKELGEKLNGN